MSYTDTDRELLAAFSIDHHRAYRLMLDALCEEDEGKQFGLFYMKRIELGRWVVEHAIHAYHFSWLVYDKPADLHAFGLFYRSFVYNYMRRVVRKADIWNSWASAVRCMLNDPWWTERYGDDKSGINAILGGSGQK